MILEVPATMVQATKGQFFAQIGPKNAVVNLNNPYFTLWEDRSRAIVGWSTPGWKNPRGERSYALPR